LLRLRAELSELLAPLAAHAYAHQRSSRKFTLVCPGASAPISKAISNGRICESIRLRQTIVGPHRDDLGYASTISRRRSLVRKDSGSIVLAMKIAQAEALKKSGDKKAPLLLIDDIFGELDP
jgi:DNA replication and repair protein RecF